MKKIIVLLLTSLILIGCSDNKQEHYKLLVVGNSITKHSPLGEWKGDWGMAATAPNKDFCGLLIEAGHSVDRINISVWERTFEQEMTITSNSYDYAIIKIGENVTDTEKFKTELPKLIKYYKNFAKKVILVTTIWKEYDSNSQETPSKRDEVIKQQEETVIDISQIKEDDTYFSWGEYQDNTIACHPNDKGHKFIANKILEKL